MAPTDAVRRATKKYLSEKVDTITIRVPKGQKKSLEMAAVADGLSLNAYICKLIFASKAVDLPEKNSNPSK